ncbi:MAG: glycerol-3-phosphate dehydrogenase, partial [Nitrospiraceae bacterium]
MSYITVIGAGSWGTTLAHLLAGKGYDVTLWAYEKNVVEEINRYRTNSAYLPGVSLSPDIEATDNIKDAVITARYILSVVPTQFTRPVFKAAAGFIPEDAVIISASKGIEQGSLLTVSSILREITDRKIAALSGPSFAKEVIQKSPTAVTLAAEDPALGLQLQEIFN